MVTLHAGFAIGVSIWILFLGVYLGNLVGISEGLRRKYSQTDRILEEITEQITELESSYEKEALLLEDFDKKLHADWEQERIDSFWEHFASANASSTLYGSKIHRFLKHDYIVEFQRVKVAASGYSYGQYETAVAVHKRFEPADRTVFHVDDEFRTANADVIRYPGDELILDHFKHKNVA